MSGDQWAEPHIDVPVFSATALGEQTDSYGLDLKNKKKFPFRPSIPKASEMKVSRTPFKIEKD